MPIVKLLLNYRESRRQDKGAFSSDVVLGSARNVAKHSKGPSASPRDDTVFVVVRSRYSAATAIACLRPGMVKPSLSSLAIMSVAVFSSISINGGRTGVQAASAP